MHLIIIIILILAVLLVIFTLQNSMEITLSIFFWEIPNAPLVLVLICCVLLGYLIAVIYFYPRLLKTKKKYNKLVKHNNELKSLDELNQEKEESNPEGIELEEDENDSFFKD